MLTTAQVDWGEAKAEVARAFPRLTTLLRTVGNPGAPSGVGEWTLTDVAVHLSHAVDAVTAVAKGGGGMVDDVWELPGMTAMLVQAEGERDLHALADRIDASAAALLDAMRAAPADDRRMWMVKGIDVPLSFATCHMLNELVMHGRDIALADGQEWPIDRRSAVLALEGFVLPVLGALGRSMVDQDAARGLTLTYDVRIRGGGRYQFLFDDGDFAIRPGGPVRPVDVHLSADPEALLLVSWNRISQWNAIPKGKLLAWGRKPWVGLKLRSLLRNP